jgi:hypothetical protein
MLSTEERQLSDAAAKALVRCIYLRFTSPTAAFKKLDFYIKGLDLEVRSLIIFGGRNITDDDVEQLTRRCPHIRSFELWDNQHNALTDAGVEHLARCTELRRVEMHGCDKLTDAAAKHLSRCPQLRIVHMSPCDNLTDETAGHLSKCQKLEFVNFLGCAKLTDATAEELSKCTHLQGVLLGHNSEGKFTDVAASHLAKCSGLRFVMFESCSG